MLTNGRGGIFVAGSQAARTASALPRRQQATRWCVPPTYRRKSLKV